MKLYELAEVEWNPLVYIFNEEGEKLAEEILKHKDLYRVTDTGYGYRYDLSIVKIE